MPDTTNHEEHTEALESLAEVCDTDAKRAIAYSRMVALLTAEQLLDVKEYVEQMS